MAAAPESASCARRFPVRGPGGGARLSHASPLDDFALLLASGPSARRWRAGGAPLMIVKKILTAPI